MFPSGSSVHPGPETEGTNFQSNQSWLSSSTYIEKPPVNLTTVEEPLKVSEKTEDSHAKTSHKHGKSKHKAFTPGKNDIFLEDVPGLRLNDAFHVDRSSNREIYKHGCIYEKHVAIFKQKKKTPILGFRNLRICDLADEETSSHKKSTKKSRYFSKVNRSAIAKPPIPIPTEVNYCTTEEFLPLVVLSDNVPTVQSNVGGTLSVCESLNRTVYEKPNDLKSWLQLLELHGKEASFLHLSEGSIVTGETLKPSERLMIMRKQLAIAERALLANPGCLNLKILMLRMEEMIVELESKGAGVQSDEVSQPDKIDRDWAQLVFTYPQLVSVWRGYLGHLMGRCGSSNVHSLQSVGGGLFTRIDAIYKRGLSKLSGIISGRILSHRPLPQTAEQTIDLLADYCHWLVQAGHAEKALAIWQAVIEFNCFRPSELNNLPYDQCILEMELFWTSGAARFGQPGSEHWQGWYRSKGKSTHDSHRVKDKMSEKKSKKTSSLIAPLEEVTPDASQEELSSKWSSITQQLKSIATSCEDALIRCSSDSMTDDSTQKLGVEVVPSVLSAAATDEQWVRPGPAPSLAGCASIGKSRTVLYRRGKAWVGLERARETVGWLPADTMATGGSQFDVEDEDPERLVLFDDVKYFLLDLNTLDPRTVKSEVDRISRTVSLQQRLLLQCLTFLGAFDQESAAAYGLPADLRLVHDLTTFGSIQRQSLAPLLTQSSTWSDAIPDSGSRTKLNPLSGAHVDIWARARRCVLDTAMLQASHVKNWNKEAATKWTVTLARLRYRVALERLVEGIHTRGLDGKSILTAWRQLGRSIMSQGQNQQDLGLWQVYGSGYWVAGLVYSTVAGDSPAAESLVSEARRIFNTALQSHPLPAEFPELNGSTSDNLMNSSSSIAQFFGHQLAPRLELLQHYVDFELGVFSGSGGLKHHLGCESFALQLLIQVPIGGSFVQPDSHNSVRPSALVKASHAYAKRMEAIWRLLTSLTPEHKAQSGTMPASCMGVLDNLNNALPTLCYLHLLFDLLTSDVQCLSDSLPGLICILLRLDRMRAAARSSRDMTTDRQTTRWSDAENKELPVSDRLCSRRFLALATGGLAAFATLRHRHRHPLLEQLFTVWAKQVEQQPGTSMLPRELLLPSQLAYLLPSRVALDRRLLPFSLPNVASLRGLLCPLFLAHFTHQLMDFNRQVSELVATALMDQVASGLRLGTRAPPDLNYGVLPALNIYLDSSLLRDSQLELYASCLPISVELILLSVELERWSSLIAGASVNQFPGCPALGKTSTCAQRVRNAFERAVRASPFFTPWLDAHNQPIHAVLLSSTPSFWAAHLRLIIWRAYMAFGWMSGSALTHQLKSASKSTSGEIDPRERRQAVKAVFYRAIEDLPWAKVLYTDLVRYCPEDVEEVVDLLAERELRLRTPLEEVDLLLTARPAVE